MHWGVARTRAALALVAAVAPAALARLRRLLVRSAHAAGAARAAAAVPDDRGRRGRRADRRRSTPTATWSTCARRGRRGGADRQPDRAAGRRHRAGGHGDRAAGHLEAGRRGRFGAPTRSASATCRGPTCCAPWPGSAGTGVTIECAAGGWRLGCLSSATDARHGLVRRRARRGHRDRRGWRPHPPR